MSDRQRRPRVLGEYELDGGAFALARGEQRDTPAPQEPVRAFGRPAGSLWRAVLRRIRTS